ncbi:MAG TPA: hypothetical protein VG935_04455 [Patescibacteria group bacterium]|nr:hypothetical protein [Patescibacteria group bacterium]
MAFTHHHEKKKIMLNLFTVPLFIGILVVVTYFSKPVRRIVNIPQKLVAGAKDNKLQDVSKENFSKEIVNDTQDQVSTLKNEVLETTVGDILNFLGKSKKISNDVNSLQHQAGDLLDKYTNLDFAK